MVLCDDLSEMILLCAAQNVVKVVKVKMVIFILGLCHLLTIYKYLKLTQKNILGNFAS